MTGLLLLHMLIAIALIVLVFIQYGRSGDMGAGMGGGGGSANSVFGASGSTDFILKLTAVVGVVFFMSSLAVGVLYVRGNAQGQGGGGVMSSYPAKPAATSTVPSVPASKSAAIPVAPVVDVPSVPVAPASDKVNALQKVDGVGHSDESKGKKQ